MQVKYLIQNLAVDFFLGFDISGVSQLFCEVNMRLTLCLDLHNFGSRLFDLVFVHGEVDDQKQVLIDRGGQVENVHVFGLSDEPFFLKFDDRLYFLELERVQCLFVDADFYELFGVLGVVVPLYC